jgi:hypothetical protein
MDRKKSLKRAGVLTEIQTKHLLSTRQENYRYANPFSELHEYVNIDNVTYLFLRTHDFVSNYVITYHPSSFLL